MTDPVTHSAGYVATTASGTLAGESASLQGAVAQLARTWGCAPTDLHTEPAGDSRTRWVVYEDWTFLVGHVEEAA